jgi:hypothetical protein
VSAGIEDGRHDDLEERVEMGDGVLGRVCLGKGREVADVDEHDRDIAALTGEHVVTLLEKSGREGRVHVGAECRPQSLTLGEPGLHPVERTGQGAEIVVLHHRQSLAVVTGRDALGAFGQIPYRSQRRRERGADRDRYRKEQCEESGDEDGIQGAIARRPDDHRKGSTAQRERPRGGDDRHARPGGEGRM